MAVLSAAVFLFAGHRLWGILRDYRAGAESYRALTEQYAADLSTAAEAERKTTFRVDVARLWEQYPSVIGWLYAPGTGISYPIAQGSDNEYYLRHLYNGEGNSAGTLFADCRNAAAFGDANTIIYGHNMKNGTMFAPLMQYRRQAYREQHPEMYLYTPDGDYRVVLFSGFATTADADVYTPFAAPDDAFAAYLSACTARSDFSPPQETAEKILTLSTCTNADALGRYVVQGYLVPME